MLPMLEPQSVARKRTVARLAKIRARLHKGPDPLVCNFEKPHISGASGSPADRNAGKACPPLNVNRQWAQHRRRFYQCR